MSDLEERIRRIEDRQAMYERLLAYYVACDRLSDVDDLLTSFTPDAEFDLSGLGLPLMQGHGAIGPFFAAVFKDMAHHAHFISNFRLSRQERDTATGLAYVIGLGRSHAGADVTVHANLEIDYVRVGDDWKITRFVEAAQMPLAGMAEAHGDRFTG